MQNSRTVSKLGRVCCKTSKLCRIPKSLSMSIDIVWSLFIRYWSILYIYHLPSPASTLTDTCLLALISFGFIIVEEIYLNCKSTNSISIIISYRVAQQLRTPLEILSLECCWLSGILSRRIFQIQELSFQPCDHSTCQTPDFSHW